MRPALGRMSTQERQSHSQDTSRSCPQLAFEEALDELAKNIAQQFPVTFVIDDACLTNSRWIWTNRHFYL